MNKLKKMWNWCPKPQKPITTRRQTAPIYFLFAASIIIASLSLSLFSHQMIVSPTPQALRQTPYPAGSEVLNFLTNVTQLDMAKYNSTLSIHDTSSPFQTVNFTVEHLKYILQGEENNATVFCELHNDKLIAFSIRALNGNLLYAQPSDNILVAARGILERYQNCTGDSSLIDMTNMLSAVDPVKDATVQVGDLKLEVTVDSQHGSFDWKYTFNGVDYQAISIIFMQGEIFFSDYRNLYDIGNTDVNVSRDEAIDIAMKYLETYSYTGIVCSDGKEISVEISGFNITKELTKANLATNFREPLTFYPCWNIELYLDQKQPYANYTYPSGVYALYVSVWADSGKVFSCTPLAVG